NFSCNDYSPRYKTFKYLVDDYDLYCCDNLNTNLPIKYTYCHNSLSNYSWIDHFFVSKKLLNSSSSFNIIDDGANLSDHNPITLCISSTNFSPTTTPTPTCNTNSSPVLRWDKANLSKFYTD